MIVVKFIWNLLGGFRKMWIVKWFLRNGLKMRNLFQVGEPSEMLNLAHADSSIFKVKSNAAKLEVKLIYFICIQCRMNIEASEGLLTAADLTFYTRISYTLLLSNSAFTSFQ